MSDPIGEQTPEVPAPNPHAQDSIQYGHVFASYTEGTADSSVDLDPYPDERWLSGTVTFRPTFSGQTASATLRVPGTPRSRGLVITEVEYKIVSSKLVDRQDREGVWLITAVDGITVYWQATVTLADARNRPILTRPYLLGPDVWTVGEDGTRTVNLPDLVPTPSALPPAGTEAVLAAQVSAVRSESAATNAKDFALDAKDRAEDASGSAADSQRSAGQAASAASSAAELATAAGGALTGAESAKGAAEDAAAAAASSAGASAGSAGTSGEFAEDASSSAEAAEGSAANADVSEANAKISETNAGVSEQSAADHKLAAEGFRDGALAARDESRAARDQADALRNQAGQHATTATEKAAEAGTQASTAADFTTTTRNFRDQAEAARDIAVANGLTWRGTWAAGTEYAAQDVVTHQGASWRAVAASTGTEPAEGAAWSLLADRGLPGKDGATEIAWGDILNPPSSFPPETHSHGPETLGSGGTRSGTTFLNGLGNWVTPFTVMSQAEAETGTDTTSRVLSAARLREVIQHRVTGAAGTAVSLIGQALNRATTKGEARSVIGAVADDDARLSDARTPTTHKHSVPGDLTTTGTASASTFLRGDGSWATPTDTNTTYSVPTQAEAEAGTATTARAFSAQRVAQGAIAASGKKDWQGTQAQYDALPTKDADRTYWIV